MIDPKVDADIDRVFSAQARGSAPAPSAGQRRDRLRRLRAAIEAHFPEVVAALAADLGKPPFEAMMDAGAPFPEIDAALASLDQWMAPVDVPLSAHAAPGASATIIHEPLGRVLIFGPWNFPFGLLFQPLAGAIAAGNTAVLKPSELVPQTSAVCAKIVRTTFDDSEVALFEGGPDVAEALLERPFEHIFFTGSTNVGRKVMAAAGRHLSSITLELGGKCPAIIDRKCDIQRAADRIAWGKFLNAGQVCLAPDHAWVPSDRRDALVAALQGYIASAYYPQGSFNATDMARILNDRHVTRLEALVADAIGRGATLVTGGIASDDRMPPTILIDVAPDSAIMGEEIFGPILPILTYDDKDMMLDRAAGGAKPLALYVFSDCPAFVDEVIARTASGGVTVNDVLQHATEPNLPMGGVGASGLGAYHGIHSFHALSHARSVYRQAPTNPAEGFLRPPYGDRLPL